MPYKKAAVIERPYKLTGPYSKAKADITQDGKAQQASCRQVVDGRRPGQAQTVQLAGGIPELWHATRKPRLAKNIRHRRTLLDDLRGGPTSMEGGGVGPNIFSLDGLVTNFSHHLPWKIMIPA